MIKKLLWIGFAILILISAVYGVTKVTSGGSEKNLPVGGGEIIVKNSTNGLFTVWVDGALITSDIQLGRSIDYGLTWNITLVDSNPTVPCETDLSMLINSSDALHVFCSRDALIHWYSVDSGTTWTDGEHIYDDDAVDFATVIIDGNDNIYGCYWNQSGTEIYGFNSSQTNTNSSGGVWSNNLVSGNVDPVGGVATCDLEADSNNNIHMAYWQGITSGNMSYSNQTSGSGIWTPAVNITDELSTVASPSIVLNSNNNISIVWNNLGDNLISYANSSDNGITWSVNQSIDAGGAGGVANLVRNRDDIMFVFSRNFFLNLSANSSIYSGWSATYSEPFITTDQLTPRGSFYPTANSYDNITTVIDYVYIATNETPDQLFYGSFEVGELVIMIVDLISPSNGNVTTETTIDFNCTAATQKGTNIDNVTFLLYDSVPALESSTERDLVDAQTQSESFTVASLSDDTYAWNCFYRDISNNVGFSGNNTVTVDTTDPNSLNIILQSNISLSTSVELNYTFNESNPDACIFSLDDGVTNTSFASCGTNATMTAPFGANTVIIYVNDTTGHQISASQDFTVITQNFTANRNVSEATTQVFNFIVYNGSSILDSAALTYNNTNVGYDSFISNGTALNFTKTLTTDLLIDFQNFTEIQYFWNSTFFVGNDFINLTSGLQVQEVHRQLVVDCSDPTANLITLNFTAVDEDTNVRQNLSGELEFLVWNEIKGSGRTYNFNYLNSSNLTETTTCIYPDWNELNSDIRFVYRNDLYPTREYNALSLLLTNSTNAITLFMGLVSSSTEIQVEIRDQNDNDLIGYLIEAYEFDLGNGSFALKDSETSNFDGLVYFNLDVTNTLWQFRVKDSEGVQIWDSGAPFELQETTYLYRLPIGLIRPSQDILAIDAFIQRAFLDYANSTRRITYSWTNTSQMGDTCLTVYNRTQGGDTIISNQCSSLNNGTLNYTLGADWDGYFVGIANVSLLTKVGDFLTYQVDSKYMDLREALLKFGREGLLYAAIIIGSLASVGIAIGSGTIAILLMIVGLMATTAIGFISVGWTLTMGMIVIGFFIILKISRG